MVKIVPRIRQPWYNHPGARCPKRDCGRTYGEHQVLLPNGIGGAMDLLALIIDHDMIAMIEELVDLTSKSKQDKK